MNKILIKISQTVFLIRKGCGYLEGYGNHPGTGILLGLIVIGGIIGLQKGFFGSFIGATMMGSVFGTCYLVGAYDRGKNFYNKNNKK